MATARALVSTVDGSATGAGRRQSINNEADGRVFRLLRDLADVIVVGAGTAQAEGYKPAAKPIVLVSRSGEVPESLRTAESGLVLMATTETVRIWSTGTLHEDMCSSSPVRRRSQPAQAGAGRTRPDERALRRRPAPADHPAGRPCSRRALRDDRAQLVGGPCRRITDGPPVDTGLDLMLLLEDAGSLIARWHVRR